MIVGMEIGNRTVFEIKIVRCLNAGEVRSYMEDERHERDTDRERKKSVILV
jgi:hypothetical protein